MYLLFLTFKREPSDLCRAALILGGLVGKLAVVELTVETVRLQQRFMIAFFDDLAVAHYENHIGILNGA